VNTLEKIRQHMPVLKVDHKENEKCDTNTHRNDPVSASVADGDNVLASVELTTTAEKSSQSSYSDTAHEVVSSCHMNSFIGLDETGVCQETSTGPDINSQCSSKYISLSDSFSDVGSDLVSQSQGLQLTNTQKVKVFAMELDMMQVPVSAYGSQSSLSDPLTEMSSVVL